MDGGSSMKVEEKLSTYLKANQEAFLDMWEKNILVLEDDPYKEEVRNNGRKMIQLVMHFIRFDYNEKNLKDLANKVAFERVQAKVNIGAFIYNVNLGRSEIFKHLNDSQIPLLDLQPTINKINYCFDQFIYYAVQSYTELKDKDLEEKNTLLQQTHKDRLTILGQMASSFVHEFRNPLTSIIGFVKLLQRENPSLKYVDVISHELEQLNYQISQFLLFSKKEVIGKTKEHFPISELVREVQLFLYPTIVDTNVQLELEVDSPIYLVGYRDEFRQVLLNLLMNAIDALKVVYQERKILVSSSIQNDEVVLSVINNGPAIPEEIMRSIFEPFFTNKELGTGIGLFVCRQIIEKHDGTISCKSTEDCTEFSIHLPLKTVNPLQKETSSTNL
jgi:signal transduction histidine kinase